MKKKSKNTEIRRLFGILFFLCALVLDIRAKNLTSEIIFVILFVVCMVPDLLRTVSNKTSKQNFVPQKRTKAHKYAESYLNICEKQNKTAEEKGVCKEKERVLKDTLEFSQEDVDFIKEYTSKNI